MGRIVRLLFLVFLLLISFSCRKDSDITPPSIDLNSPVENAQYQVPAEIPVIGTVYDEISLKAIRIQLLDENMVPAGQAVHITPEENSYSINQSLVIDNILLDPGIYFLHVQASDGVQATNRYVKIYLNEAPRELKCYIAVTRSNSTLRIYRINPDFNDSLVLSRTSDYLGSSMMNDYGLFFISGSYNGSCTAYDVNTWQMQWEVPVTIDPPFAWFTGIYVDPPYLWLGYRSGKYEKYDAYGAIKMSVNTHTGFAPLSFCLAGDKLVTEEKNPFGQDREMVVHYEFSGVVHDELFVSDPAVALLPLAQDKLCFISNSGTGNALWQAFDVSTASVWTPPSNFDPGKVNAALRVDDFILAAHEDGIYRLLTGNYNLLMMTPGLNSAALAYDRVNRRILAADGTSVRFYSDQWPVVTLQQTIPLGDTVIAIHCVYNKD